MAVTAYRKSNLDLRKGRISSVDFATAGFYYTHATEGGNIKGKMPGKYEFKTQDVKDYAARPWEDAMDVTIELPMMETTFPRWKDVHLLSQYPHNLRINTPEGEYLNFQPTTNNDYVNPNGSEMVGLDYLFKIPNKGGRTLTGTWKTTLFDSQEEWIYNNMGVAGAGGSGGVALGLTSFVYDPTAFVPSNFAYGLIDGNDIGIMMDGISLELQTKGFISHRGSPYSQFLNVKATLILAGSSATMLLAGLQNGRLDKTLSLISRTNEQFNFLNGAVRPGRTFSSEDAPGKRMQTIVLEGEMPYDNISFAIGTPNVASFIL